MISQWQLRDAFAARLSGMYGREAPACTTLVDVSRKATEEVLRAQGADAERLDSHSRVTAERHGAICIVPPNCTRSPVSSAPGTCTRWASTTCAKPPPARSPSYRPRSPRPLAQVARKLQLDGPLG
ncbi:uncharacterized protein DUF1338 [Streptomyces sp. TLI_185]|nr:uncharacterized protein DUF1338 [Streptomyces sp. TLI_185]